MKKRTITAKLITLFPALMLAITVISSGNITAQAAAKKPAAITKITKSNVTQTAFKDAFLFTMPSGNQYVHFTVVEDNNYTCWYGYKLTEQKEMVYEIFKCPVCGKENTRGFIDADEHTAKEQAYANFCINNSFNPDYFIYITCECGTSTYFGLPEELKTITSSQDFPYTIRMVPVDAPE